MWPSLLHSNGFDSSLHKWWEGHFQMQLTGKSWGRTIERSSWIPSENRPLLRASALVRISELLFFLKEALGGWVGFFWKRKYPEASYAKLDESDARLQAAWITCKCEEIYFSWWLKSFTGNWIIQDRSNVAFSIAFEWLWFLVAQMLRRAFPAAPHWQVVGPHDRTIIVNYQWESSPSHQRTSFLF